MLEIVAAGFTFRARFEEAAAPATVEAFRAILPFEDRIIHCRWSGESNWIPWGDRELGIGPENATCFPAPGQLLLYPGGISETELLFPYGHCAFGSKAGRARREPLRDGGRGRRALRRARQAHPVGGCSADRVSPAL